MTTTRRRREVGQAETARIIPFPTSRPSRANDPEALLRLIRSIRHPGLRHYCVDRIRSARSLEDVAETVEFVHQVTGTGR
jgi:hypothetical protein